MGGSGVVRDGRGRALWAALLVVAALAVPVLGAGPAQATTTTSFSNSAGITINDATPGVGGTVVSAATPDPSTISVSGLTGVVAKVTVTLTNVTHTHLQDVDVLLVSPADTRIMVFSDVPGGSVSNRTFTMDIDAAAYTDGSTSGTFRPTNFFGNPRDQFPGPIGFLFTNNFTDFEPNLSRFNG